MSGGRARWASRVAHTYGVIRIQISTPRGIARLYTSDARFGSIRGGGSSSDDDVSSSGLMSFSRSMRPATSFFLPLRHMWWMPASAGRRKARMVPPTSEPYERRAMTYEWLTQKAR